MPVTGRQLAQTVLTALERQGGYIWGQSGAAWTQAKQKNLEKKYSSNPEAYADYKYSAKYGSKWIGHPVWDCSGLCRWAMKQHGIAIAHGSNSIWDRYLQEKGKLTDATVLPEGAAVFTGTDQKKPHIGTYTGDGLVTEASGTIAGVVRTKLYGGKWKYWGLFKGVQYETPAEDPAAQSPAAESPADPTAGMPGSDAPTAPSAQPAPSTPVSAARPTLRKGSKGEPVTAMQQALLRAGFPLPKYGADGKFGNETRSALKAFQKANGLQADGICGPKTWAALEP